MGLEKTHCLVIYVDIQKSKVSVQTALYKELNTDLTKLSIRTWIYWVKLYSGTNSAYIEIFWSHVNMSHSKDCHNHNVLMSHDFFVD